MPEFLNARFRQAAVLLARIIHEHFCCNRGFAATTSLRRAGSPFAPSTYCWGLAPFFLAPVPVGRAAGQAPPQRAEPVPWAPRTRLATNRHESCGLEECLQVAEGSRP